MKILLTGATGFIGGHLMDRFHERHELVAVARGGRPGDAPAGVNWVKQDLARPLSYGNLPERIDAVIHLAQSRSYRLFPEGAEDMFDVNIRGTFALLEYARRAGAGRFVLASSGTVYGRGEAESTEEGAIRPANFYARTKYAAEQLAAGYESFFHVAILRLFAVYGPGQQDALMPNLLRKVREGEAIEVDGGQGLRINPIFVEDAVRAVEAALSVEESGLFNVAGDETVSIRELVELLGEMVGRDTTVRSNDNAAGGDVIGDNTRMKGVLRVFPETRLADGLCALL